MLLVLALLQKRVYYRETIPYTKQTLLIDGPSSISWLAKVIELRENC